MKLKIRDLAIKIGYSESRLRALLCREELSSFVVTGINEYKRPIMYFDYNETSKKILMRYKKGYKPEENEDIKKYIDENIKLQKEKAILIDAIKKINKEIRLAYCNKFFFSLSKKETENILKIIKDVLK